MPSLNSQIIITKEEVLGSNRIAEATSFEEENTQQYSGTSTAEVLSLSVFLRQTAGRRLPSYSRFVPKASTSRLVLDSPLMR